MTLGMLAGYSCGAVSETVVVVDLVGFYEYRYLAVFVNTPKFGQAASMHQHNLRGGKNSNSTLHIH